MLDKDLKDKVLVIKKQLQENAAFIDEKEQFPVDNLNIIKDSGLMALIIPSAYGGLGKGIKELVEITKLFSEDCMSTALIWSMHCQQTSVILQQPDGDFKKSMIDDVVNKKFYIGSVTTETGKGGHLLTANSPLLYEDDNTVKFDRFAPVITGGKYCDAYLMTMRKSESHSSSDTVLVYVRNNDVITEEMTKPSMLGLKGSHTVSMRISGKISKQNVLSFDFKMAAIEYMIPVGHLVWAACWFGSAQYIYNNLISKIFRDPKNRKNYDLDSELFLEKIARIKSKLDITDIYLRSITDQYFEIVENSKNDELKLPSFQLRINNLKIISSEYMFDVMNDIINLVGIRFGYIKNEHVAIERVFRDLRAGSIMYHNNRLLTVNGKLCLFEKSNLIN